MIHTRKNVAGYCNQTRGASTWRPRRRGMGVFACFRVTTCCMRQPRGRGEVARIGLSESDREWYIEQQGCVDTKITCPKGGIVLWDSRTIHASTNPVKGRSNPGCFRMTTFVSMNPRTHVSASVAKRRRAAFGEGRTTTHWPARMNLFGKKPRTYYACVAPPVERKAEWESLV